MQVREQVGERREGEGFVGLGRPSCEHPLTTFAREPDACPPERRLPDARLALDDECACALDECRDLRELPLSPDELDLGCLHAALVSRRTRRPTSLATIGAWPTSTHNRSKRSSRKSDPAWRGSVITFDPDALAARRAQLEEQMGAPGFWDDQERAADISTEHSRVQRKLERYEALTRDYEDARELYSMDGGMEAEIAESITPLEQELDRLEEEALFSGEYDAGDAVVTLQSDVGGTDAQDFTEMLLRMYERWAQHRGFKIDMVEASPGEEAGLKSATFTIGGENAYGILRAERGKHRLVRLSPFDQAHRRHTSFAQVIPSPLLAHDAVEID